MNRNNEANLRRAGRIAAGVSVSLALIALVLAIRGDSTPASIVLTLALISLAVTWLSYKQYQSLRNDRWQQELAGTEAEMARLLTAKPSTVTLAKRKKRDNSPPEHTEEQPVARS